MKAENPINSRALSQTEVRLAKNNCSRIHVIPTLQVTHGSINEIVFDYLSSYAPADTATRS